MRDIGKREIVDLGESYGIEIRETEAADMAQRVNDLLVGVDELFEMPGVDDSNENAGLDRGWSTGDDRYNSIVTACNISDPDGGSLLDEMSVGLKDNIAVGGVPLTCGSAAMRGYIAEADATVARRLLEHGARITAKTNMDEFASGGPWGLSSAYRGTIKNPCDTERTAGGSSGGSAAAVAAELVDAALGSDTGGSIRIPASFCGVVGLKPTNGLVPLTDVAETSRSQDTVGPITRSIADAARVLEAISGADSEDPNSLAAATDGEYTVGGYVEAAESPTPLEELTIGVLKEGLEDSVQDQVADRTRSTLDDLADAGATIEDVSVDKFSYGKPIKNVIRYFEGVSYLRDNGLLFRTDAQYSESLHTAFAARSNDMSGTFSNTFKSKMLAGAELMERRNGNHYQRAQKARLVLRESFDDVLQEVDVIATPTMPAVAPRLDSIDDYYGKSMTEEGSTGFDFAQNLRAINATGHPGITMPNGRLDDLPVGLHLIGNRFGERNLLSAAVSVESVV